MSSASSSHSTSARSKEQLDLDISALAIKIQSQQRRARLEKEKLDVEKKKLDIELEMEKNNLQEEMDLAKNERESLDRENSDIMQTPEQIKNPVNEEIQKMLNGCYTFIDDCCAYLGSGKVDLNGKKACRVYMSPDKNPNPNKTEPEKTYKYKIPRTSTVKKKTEKLAKPISVCPQKDEAEPRIITVTRRLPETPIVTRRLPEIPTKESSIGYFPSPRPEHSDKALEALYRQQTMMMGALHAPKIELMEFHGDPMLYHAFIRSFEENVEKMLPDDGARLARLMHLCKGEAGRAIRCCNLMNPEQGYARARRLLKQRFGDSHTITELWIKKLNEGGPRVNLQEYADELLDCYESLKALGALQEMDAQRNLLAMITRLPMHLQNKWQDHVYDLKSRENRRPTLKDVVNFVDRAAAVVSDPVYGSASIRSERAEKPTTRAAYVATADVRCPICNEGEHSVSQCRKFIEMNPNERLDTALRKQICFMCLIPGHITRECTNPVKCQAKGCGQRHATMLHEADWEGLRRTSRERREAKAGSSPETEGYHGHHVVSSHHVMGSKVALPFLLVKGTSPETGISVKTYALLDSGSSVSLCQDRLLQMLKARGRTEKMSLTTLERKNHEATARVVSLKVSTLYGNEDLTIPQVFTRPNCL